MTLFVSVVIPTFNRAPALWGSRCAINGVANKASCSSSSMQLSRAHKNVPEPFRVFRVRRGKNGTVREVALPCDLDSFLRATCAAWFSSLGSFYDGSNSFERRRRAQQSEMSAVCLMGTNAIEEIAFSRYESVSACEDDGHFVTKRCARLNRWQASEAAWERLEVDTYQPLERSLDRGRHPTCVEWCTHDDDGLNALRRIT